MPAHLALFLYRYSQFYKFSHSIKIVNLLKAFKHYCGFVSLSSSLVVLPNVNSDIQPWYSCLALYECLYVFCISLYMYMYVFKLMCVFHCTALRALMMYRLIRNKYLYLYLYSCVSQLANRRLWMFAKSHGNVQSRDQTWREALLKLLLVCWLLYKPTLTKPSHPPSIFTTKHSSQNTTQLPRMVVDRYKSYIIG